MKILIDTNVWISFFIDRDPIQNSEAIQIVEAVVEGDIKGYVSIVTMIELNYFFMKYLKMSQAEAVRYLTVIVEMRNLQVLTDMDMSQVLDMDCLGKLKMTDTMIISQIPQGAQLVTYDRDIVKLAKYAVTPTKLLATYRK